MSAKLKVDSIDNYQKLEKIGEGNTFNTSIVKNIVGKIY